MRRTAQISAVAAVVALMLSLPLYAQDGGNAEIGIDEKLGNNIPENIILRDEQGRPVRLDELVDGPTILSLVYFSCPAICTPLLNGMSDVFAKTDLKPGEDYRVITVSFDTNDDAELARKKKKNQIASIGRPFPEDAWRFLTGDRQNIDRLTDAVGFRYKKTGREFQHAAALIVLSPEGKITRYLYGVTFLPFDVKMAVAEASKGKTSPTINRILLYCFSYDPAGETYVFNLLKVTGTVTIVFLALFLLFLFITTKKYRKKTVRDEQGKDRTQLPR